MSTPSRSRHTWAAGTRTLGSSTAWSRNSTRQLASSADPGSAWSGERSRKQVRTALSWVPLARQSVSWSASLVAWVVSALNSGSLTSALSHASTVTSAAAIRPRAGGVRRIERWFRRVRTSASTSAFSAVCRTSCGWRPSSRSGSSCSARQAGGIESHRDAKRTDAAPESAGRHRATHRSPSWVRDGSTRPSVTRSLASAATERRYRTDAAGRQSGRSSSRSSSVPRATAAVSRTAGTSQGRSRRAPRRPGRVASGSLTRVGDAAGTEPWDGNRIGIVAGEPVRAASPRRPASSSAGSANGWAALAPRAGRSESSAHRARSPAAVGSACSTSMVTPWVPGRPGFGCRFDRQGSDLRRRGCERGSSGPRRQLIGGPDTAKYGESARRYQWPNESDEPNGPEPPNTRPLSSPWGRVRSG